MLSRGAHQDWEKKPASVSLLWSCGFIVLPIRLLLLGLVFEISHAAKVCTHGSAARICRARSSRDDLPPSSLQPELSPALV
jgi:hypothetical protein